MTKWILAAALAVSFAPMGAVHGQVINPARAGYSSILGVASFDSAWNRIHATHYDASFNGIDWQAVRSELRPKAAAAATQDELRGVIRAMLERLGESHFSLIPAEIADALDPSAATSAGAPGDLGLELRLVQRELAVWRVDPAGPAARAGIRPGWIVESIGGYRPERAHARMVGMEPAAARRALTQYLFAANSQTEGPAGSVVELRLRDGKDRPVTRTVRRRERPGDIVRFGHMPAFIAHLEHERRDGPGGCVGVIRFNVWMVPLRAPIDAAVDALRDCRGMVLDLRGNPGGIAGMVMGVAGHFLDQPVSLGTMRARGSELHFRANPRRVNAAAQPVVPFEGPVAILVDAMSVSTSEIFAGGMQAIGRARIFGQTTSGQALPAALLRLPDGDLLMHVVADFTDAGGTRIEGRGVVPDAVVELVRTDLLDGRDAVGDAALAWIRSH